MKKGDVMRGWLIGLIGLILLAGPARAEVRIHLFDTRTPVVTDQVFEEESWVLYQEGDSGYLFSVSRDRIEKLEIVRDGAVLTLQITSRGQRGFKDPIRPILLGVAQIRDKHLEELRKRYEEEVGKIGEAARAANEARQAAGALGPSEALFLLAIQRARAEKTLLEYIQVQFSQGKLLELVGQYRKDTGPKPKYYFHR